MSELEEIGLLYSPHISSGRLPTSYGLKLYINSIMQFSEQISESEKESINNIESMLKIKETDLLQTVSSSLSGISMQTGIVVEKKFIVEIKHIEFVRISSDKALVVLVDSKGSVENRIISEYFLLMLHLEYFHKLCKIQTINILPSKMYFTCSQNFLCCSLCFYIVRNGFVLLILTL